MTPRAATRRPTPPGLARSVRIPALVSAALVIPFIVLESMNRRGLHEEFPIALFGRM